SAIGKVVRQADLRLHISSALSGWPSTDRSLAGLAGFEPSWCSPLSQKVCGCELVLAADDADDPQKGKNGGRRYASALRARSTTCCVPFIRRIAIVRLRQG